MPYCDAPTAELRCSMKKRRRASSRDAVRCGDGCRLCGIRLWRAGGGQRFFGKDPGLDGPDPGRLSGAFGVLGAAEDEPERERSGGGQQGSVGSLGSGHRPVGRDPGGFGLGRLGECGRERPIGGRQEFEQLGASTSTAGGTGTWRGSFGSRSCGRASTSGCERKTRAAGHGRVRSLTGRPLRKRGSAASRDSRDAGNHTYSAPSTGRGSRRRATVVSMPRWACPGRLQPGVAFAQLSSIGLARPGP